MRIHRLDGLRGLDPVNVGKPDIEGKGIVVLPAGRREAVPRRGGYIYQVSLDKKEIGKAFGYAFSNSFISASFFKAALPNF